MRPHYISDHQLNLFIQQALNEDIGERDHSSWATVEADATGQASLLVKEPGVIAGVELAEYIFRFVDPSVQMDINTVDGEQVQQGDVAFKVKGNLRAILSSERLILNCMQRMSGIATSTNAMVKCVEGYKAKIIDTRKTTPLFRAFEKWAVLIGGGKNNRLGLFDMIMIKDNHIVASGGISGAIQRTKDYLRANKIQLPVEIEVSRLDELDEVLATGGVDIIMLDNMEVDLMKKAVVRVNGKYMVEASGGITIENIRAIAACEVDYISVGGLTHTVKSLDLSLKISEKF